MPKTTGKLEDPSAAPRLTTIVTSPNHIAEAMQVEQKTADRIYKAMQIIRDGAGKVSAAATDEAAAAVERSELASQALLDATDLTAAVGDFVTSLRINMDAMEQHADSNAGAQGFVMNFLTIYAYQHPATMAEILDKMNLGKVTIAATAFMEIERVYHLVTALINAAPALILQHIMETLDPNLFAAAAKKMKGSRVSVIVEAMLQEGRRW